MNIFIIVTIIIILCAVGILALIWGYASGAEAEAKRHFNSQQVIGDLFVLKDLSDDEIYLTLGIYDRSMLNYIYEHDGADVVLKVCVKDCNDESQEKQGL